MISARCRYVAYDTLDEEEASVHFMSSGKPLLWHVFLWAGLHSVCLTRDIQLCMIRHTGLMALCPGKLDAPSRQGLLHAKECDSQSSRSVWMLASLIWKCGQ